MPFSKSILALAACAAAMITTPIFAQSQERLSRECRQEVRELCASTGRDRDKLRACVREKFSELSEECSGQLRDRVEQRRGEQPQTVAYPRIPVTRTVLYGPSTRQQVDVYEPADAVEELPLVLYIHGGGWSFGDRKNVQAKPAHFLSKDFYFASAGYRVLPDAPVEEQAADIGAALQALRGQAFSIGFDPDRIVLMGHSAGAHLAALVASDPKYAGEASGAIKGVILLDGAGYDVPARVAEAGPQAFQLFTNVFGSDPARQAELSPITHIGGEDAPHWLALYGLERAESKRQSQALMNALVEAGVQAGALPITDTDHARINREIGTEPGAMQTEAIDAFLTLVFG